MFPSLLKKFTATFILLMLMTEGAFAAAMEADSMSFVGIRKSRTANILDTFKERQGQLFFENAPFTEEEEFGLFDAERKIKALNDVVKRIENTRSQYQEKKLEVTKEKISLRTSIRTIDDAIDKTLSVIRDTEIEIIKRQRTIEGYEKKIDSLKEQIDSNRKSILEYLAYLYTKGDLIYGDEQEFDVVKSILLNDGNLSDIINDIHYKSLLETAGQNFVEIHRGLVRQYYLDTAVLKKEKVENLRLKSALRGRHADLWSQRSHKERLLSISQGKEALFNRFIVQKTQRENELSGRIGKLEEDYENVFEEVSSKNGCSVTGSGVFDAGKSKAKCTELKQFYEAEKTLRDSSFSSASGSNIFSWPVSPKYVSSYFKDQEYYASLGSEHEGVDLPVEQGSDISAPSDGYVYYVNPPTEGGYGFIALKHSDGYLTVYGHVSEVMAERFEFVPAGKVFAKSGGAPGTPGAGIMTSGAHLHFEIHKDRVSVDPLRYLDLTYLRYESLDAKYRYKFTEDLKSRYGRRANMANYDTFTISGTDEASRQQFLLDKYAVGDFRKWDVWVEESLSAKIDPSFLMCVGLAETGLGKNMKTSYNVGNVGNTDSGGTYDFESARDGIYWMSKTLNNKYLGNYDKLSDLSRWGNKSGSIYASSSKNWHTNIVRCLSALKGRFIEDDYRFRIVPVEPEEKLPETVSIRKRNVVTKN